MTESTDTIPVVNLSWHDVQVRAKALASRIRIAGSIRGSDLPENATLYGIPRGGIYVAMLLAQHGFELTEDAVCADAFVDDVVATGDTAKRFNERHGNKPFFTLIDKSTSGMTGSGWITFPWERMQGVSGAQDSVTRMLEYIGEDPKREGLLETPTRVMNAWGELFSGYQCNPEDVMTVFEDGACQEMVVLRDIEFYSHCEHHIMPFFGRAHIGYIPDGKIIGISKLARLLEIFSRRLQIQERLGQQITNALMEYLEPQGCGCILQAQHFCMTSRGVSKQSSTMVTSSLQGSFQEDKVKSEFLRVVGL